MKKYLFVICLFIASMGNAQVTLEKTYNGRILLAQLNTDDFWILSTATTISFYRVSDHSLYKTCQIPIIQGYSGSAYWGYASQKMFNSSDDIEFVWYYTGGGAASTVTRSVFKSIVYNENGVSLYTYDGLVNVNRTRYGTKLTVSNIAYTTSVVGINTLEQSQVYKFNNEPIYPASSVSGLSESLKGLRVADPYPNPASNYIEIPYQINSSQGIIEIYNASGVLVKSIVIGPVFSEVYLDTALLPSGAYIYYIIENGDRRIGGKFIVEK